MVWYFLTVLVLLGVILYPHAKIAYARLLMFKRLGKICSKEKLKLKVLRRHIFFADNKSPLYDFTVEKENAVIAVKIWSQPTPDATVIFREGGLYSIVKSAKKIIPSAKPRKGIAVTEKPLQKPVRNFEPGDKKVLPALLIYPATTRIHYITRDGAEYVIEPGDRIFEKTLLNYKLFEKILKE